MASDFRSFHSEGGETWQRIATNSKSFIHDPEFVEQSRERFDEIVVDHRCGFPQPVVGRIIGFWKERDL